MKIIKSGLWPARARRVATAHNHKCHDGKCVAYSYVDKARPKPWTSHYEVRCPACPPEQQGRLGLKEKKLTPLEAVWPYVTHRANCLIPCTCGLDTILNSIDGREDTEASDG